MSTYGSQETANMESDTLKVQNNKTTNSGREKKHFFGMNKKWIKLPAVQVIELLFQEAGLANQINMNLSAFFLNRFSYWIWSWRRQVRESRKNEFISEWCEKIKDTQQLAIVSDY